MLDLLAEGHEDSVPAPWPPPGGLEPEHDPFAAPKQAVVIEKDELASFGKGEIEVEPERRRRVWAFSQDRAIALSVILHVLLMLAFVIVPPGQTAGPDDPNDPLGLIKLMSPAPPEPPIPVQLFPSPGPKAPAPGKHPRLSDVDRQAHGGDPRLPKAETPRAVAQPGIQDLAPGKPSERDAAAAARAAQAAQQAQQAQAAPPEAPAQGAPILKGIPGGALKDLTASALAAQGGAGHGGQSGDDGGGWDSDGGFVDSGPLAFDTAGYEWGPYAAEMIRRIKRHWEIPQLARYGIKGRLTLRFFILKDGRVEGLRLLQSSGIPPYDNAALMAIKTSSPFRPLPADLGHDREGVTISFLYNMRGDEPDPPPQQQRRPGPR